MRSLANESDKTAVLGRLRALKPDSARRWGKMSPHEMVCHLNDSFKAAIGTKPVSSVNTNMLIRTLARWFALCSGTMAARCAHQAGDGSPKTGYVAN